MIKAAAIRQEGKIYTLPRPARHPDIIAMMVREGLPTPIRGEQGFITHEDEFVDRITAANIALACMQCNNLIAQPRLYSEDLW